MSSVLSPPLSIASVSHLDNFFNSTEMEMEIERNYEMFADYSIFVCAVGVEPTCVVLFLDFPLSPLLFASLALFMVQFKVGHPHSGKHTRNPKLVKRNTGQKCMVIRYHNFHQGTGISYSLSCFSCFPLISPKK